MYRLYYFLSNYEIPFDEDFQTLSYLSEYLTRLALAQPLLVAAMVEPV
jgi:hypothetical protein